MPLEVGKMNRTIHPLKHSIQAGPTFNRRTNSLLLFVVLTCFALAAEGASRNELKHKSYEPLGMPLNWGVNALRQLESPKKEATPAHSFQEEYAGNDVLRENNQPRAGKVAPSHQLSPLCLVRPIRSGVAGRREQYKTGICLLKLGKLAEAKIFFQATLRGDPNFSPAHQALGRVFFSEGNLADAKAEFVAALGSGSESAELHVQLAGVLIQEKEYAGAMWEVLKALKLDGKYVPAIGSLSFIFDRIGDSAGAVSWLKSTIPSLPRSGDLYVFLGSHQYRAGQYAEARASFQRAVQLAPRSGAAHYGVGLTLLKIDFPNNVAQAAREFRTAVHLDPQNALPYLQLGRLASQENDLAGAANYLEKAGKVGPASAEVLAELGKVYRRAGKMDKAEAAFRSAISLDPQMSPAVNGLAQLLEARGSKDEARVYFDQVQKLQVSAQIQAEALVIKGTGLQAEKEGRLEDAISAFRKAMSLDPNADSAYDLGSALLEQGDLKEAIKYFRLATRARPSFVNAQLELAKALKKVGDPSANDEWTKAQLLEGLWSPGQEKLAAADQAIQKYNSAVSLMRSGKTREAVQEFWKAINLSPDFTEAHYALGVLLMRLGDQVGAKQEFDTVLKLNPDSADAHNNLGALLAQDQEYSEAIWHVLEGLRLNPRDAKARINLSNILIAEDDLDAAIDQLHAAIGLTPQNALLFIYLGSAQWRARKSEAAIQSFKHAVELDPDSAPAHRGLGEVLLELGKYPDASSEFSSALRLDPSNATTHLQMARAFMQQGDLAHASGHLETAVLLRPTDVDAHAELGKVYAQLKKPDLAEKELRVALALKPENSQAVYLLARVLTEAGKSVEAKSYFDRYEILRRASADKDLVPKLNAEGNDFRQQGHLDQAVDAYKKALAINPASSEVAYNLGLALVSQGKTSEGIQAFRQAIRSRPSFVLAQNALVLTLEKVGDPSAQEERRKEELLKNFLKPTSNQELSTEDAQ
jgi:tetratricopeptide (TPR) repeat protein